MTPAGPLAPLEAKTDDARLRKSRRRRLLWPRKTMFPLAGGRQPSRIFFTVARRGGRMRFTYKLFLTFQNILYTIFKNIMYIYIVLCFGHKK